MGHCLPFCYHADMTTFTVTIKYIGIFVVKNPSSEIWSCPFSIIASKTFPNGCDIIWSIRQWRHWTSIWESEKRPHIWELDADLRIGRRLERVTLMSWKLTWNVLKMSWKVHKGLYLFLLSNGLSSNLKMLNTLAYI